MMTLYMMEKMSTKKKYQKPMSEAVEMAPNAIMQFNSGWNVDGNHQGGVKR